MQSTTRHARLLTPCGWLDADITFDTRIRAIVPRAAEAGQRLPVMLPGFIDLHCHGGGGRDIMQGGDAAPAVSRTHARHGTTSFLATTMTAPAEDIEAALRALAPHVAQRPQGGARILGVHLEGPYISPHKLGAQPPNAVPGRAAEFDAWNAIAPIRVCTIAPEMPGHLEMLTHLVSRGARAQLGHSTGSYEAAVAALNAGASSFTHLFNAMSALHHREPGLVGAALAHATHSEIIPDLLHVHPGAIRAAWRCIPGLFAVTDATSATGMPDGDYRLGSHTVHKCLGGVRLADGTLAGSCLTMDQALRNLVHGVGLSLAEASHALSRHPAQFLQLPDRGQIAVGQFADLVVLDEALALQEVFVEGEGIAPAPAAAPAAAMA
ncbi:N-acetylglucosamine-6-phosphate deacetylase [Amphibiibacter pelophylacis]|uniref:N-acetylglucosamine-6-phosphate deacetylase n=1 Tax=Amphibiibacter pelophylacis TaxID=1799477 RepID=A0ACC6P2V2_9BURK